MKPFEIEVSSKYGSPMGRSSDNPANLEGRKTYLWLVRMHDGDYDKGGAYWGGSKDSEPLFCAHSEADYKNEEITVYFRAKDKTEARKYLSSLGALEAKTRAPRKKWELLDSLDTFTTQYIETLLWSTTDNSNDSGGDPLDDNYGIEDLTLKALKECIEDCRNFQKDQAELLKQAGDESQNGHDFALTRNGYGAGFWDRGYGEIGTKLTEACKPYGSCDLTVYRGKLYL